MAIFAKGLTSIDIEECLSATVNTAAGEPFVFHGGVVRPRDAVVSTGRADAITKSRVDEITKL